MQYSSRASRRLRSRRWPVLVLGVGLVAGGTVCALRVQSLARELVPSYLHAHLQEALGRPVQWDRLRILPTGVMLEDVRVPPAAGQSALQARRVYASLNWWQLLTQRRLQVSGLSVDGLRLRLPGGTGGAGGGAWTQQVLDLSRSGISRVRLRNSTVEGGEARSGWAVRGVAGDLVVHPGAFRCSGQAASFEGSGVSLGQIHLAANGDAQGLQITSGRLAYRGAHLSGSGRVDLARNSVGMTLHVTDLPLSRLARQLGLPPAWAMRGQVTGDVTVAAGSNVLQRVSGTVRIARGSITRGDGQLPWTLATGRVLWTPKQTRLWDLLVAGQGVTLAGQGSVLTARSSDFARGGFQFHGRLIAEGTPAVTRVSQLLAFRHMLGGHWEAGRAAIVFSARGPVSDLALAHAEGQLQVDALRFRMAPESGPIAVSRLAAGLQRTPDRLLLRHLVATTDGLTLQGDAALASGVRPDALTATGSLEVRDLHSLRGAFPQAGLWEWIPASSPGASGRLQFALTGPSTDLAGLRSSGRFELHGLRLATRTPVASGVKLDFPVATARGDYEYTRESLALEHLNLGAPGFGAEGRVKLDLRGAEPQVAAGFRVNTDDWRALPGMPATAIPELRGGHFEGEVHAAGGYLHLASLPIDGSFSLRDATYTPGRPGARPLAVDEFAARFRWADQALGISSLTFETPLLRTQASGKIYAGSTGYRLALDADSHSDHAGELANRFLSDPRLAEGVLASHLHLDAPVERLQDAELAGYVGIQGLRTLSPVPALGNELLRAREISLEFSRAGSHWDVPHLLLDAPSLHLDGRGSLVGSQLTADLHARADRWNAPASLPVEGGSLSATGRLDGDVEQITGLAFTGDVALEGAQCRYEAPRLGVSGGELRLAAHGAGPVADPLAWLQGGELHLAAARVRVGRREPRALDLLTGAFTRQGDGFRWSDARLAALGGQAVVGGSWCPTAWEARIDAAVPQVARLGITLPAGVQVNGARVQAVVSGTPRQPLARAEGHAELDGVMVAVDRLPAQSFPAASAEFRFDPHGIRLEKAVAAGPAGRLEGNGEWSGAGYTAHFTAAGDSLAKLGLRLPAGFAVGGYRVDGEVSGGTGRPLAARGSVRLAGLRAPFGPEAPHDFGTATARFQMKDRGARLSEIEVDGPSGHITGAGRVGDAGYELSLASAALDPRVARWLLPGTVEGGRLAGTLEISGSRAKPVGSAAGRFELTNAGYTPPELLGLLGGATPVSRFAGDYRWESGHTRLDHLVLESAVGRGTGTFDFANERGTLTADLGTENLGRLGDLWPLLAGKLTGGTGTGHLESSFGTAGFAGTLRLEGRDGVLRVPGMEGELAENPMDSAAATLAFAPGKLTFRDVRLRGPRGNVDGEGEWSESGAVWGKGHAWYTRDYSAHLMKPSGLGWLARLFGVRQLKTDFTLNGNADRVTLNADITRGLLWRFARGRVPKEFQQIAAGKAPLWVRPLEVAESPAAAEKP